MDNEATFRNGLKTVLQSIGDVEIVAEAANGQEFLNIIEKTAADLIFMDIKMPVVDGIEATRLSKQHNPNLVIIGFSSFENQDYINKMRDAGANGYLFKSADNYDKLSEILSNPNTGCFFSTHKKIFNA